MFLTLLFSSNLPFWQKILGGDSGKIVLKVGFSLKQKCDNVGFLYNFQKLQT